MAAVDNAPDAASVQATLETYNAYCDEGNDPAFDRTADTLAPVSLDGPFYAWPLYPGGCSTLGGPKKNTEANVVDCNDQPHPAPVRRRMLRQHGRPHVRHLGRKQRREHGVGPHRRTKRRKPRSVGRQAK